MRKEGCENGEVYCTGCLTETMRCRSPETPSIKNITPSCPRSHPPTLRAPWSAAQPSSLNYPAPLRLTAATGPNNNVPLLDLHSLHRALKYASHEDHRATQRPSLPRTLEPRKRHPNGHPRPSGRHELALSPGGNVSVLLLAVEF